MGDFYILEGHEAKECDMTTWAKRSEASDRTVAVSNIHGSKVSTVFLGLDHSFDGGAPLLFETLVFGGDLDGEMDRYGTWDEAVAGHAAMMERIKNQ